VAGGGRGEGGEGKVVLHYGKGKKGRCVYFIRVHRKKQRSKSRPGEEKRKKKKRGGRTDGRAFTSGGIGGRRRRIRILPLKGE